MNVVYTFDDAFIDGIAWMSCYREPATFFVSPGLVGNNAMPLYVIGGYEKEFRMDWNDLKLIQKLKGEIGCHGWMHERYDKIDGGSAKTFLQHCDDAWGMYIGARPKSFAYADHKVGHLTLVKQYHPYVRSIPTVPDPMFWEDGKTKLYVWHKATGPTSLYEETEKLRKQQVKFITFGDACEQELIPHL